MVQLLLIASGLNNLLPLYATIGHVGKETKAVVVVDPWPGNLRAEQGSGRSPQKILTKMSAFEAFSCNLEAEPLQGSGWIPQKILIKMTAFEAFSSNLEAEPLRGSGAEPPENFDKNGWF